MHICCEVTAPTYSWAFKIEKTIPCLIRTSAGTTSLDMQYAWRDGYSTGSRTNRRLFCANMLKNIVVVPYAGLTTVGNGGCMA